MEERKNITTSASPGILPMGAFQLPDAELRLTEDDLPCSDGIPMETEQHVTANISAKWRSS